jgi:hypothetical protein
VIVNPSKLAPGETATVTFEKTGGEDMFDVAILTNDTSRCGKLVSSSGASGIALQADRGTVQYVAPASVTGDSIVMSIKASSYGICGGIFIHGIVSDVSKNTPGLASTQSLKKKSSLSKGKSLTSLKKVVRQRVAQPLSKQDQKMIMLSVAKRVADNTCPLPTQVVVENDQLVDCTKASEPRTAEARKDGKGCTPQLGERPPASASGNDDGITFEIEVCRDVNFKQPRVRPKQAYFPFFYGLCKKNIEDYPLTLKNIEDVVPGDTATACSMKRQLKVRMADRLQGNGGYWPGTFVTESELIAHEKAHLPQWREIFKEAYSNLLQSGKYLITPSDAEDIKNDSQKRNAWVGKMVTDVVDLAKGIESDRHQSDERAANIRQGKELSTLVKSLQKSYPTCK